MPDENRFAGLGDQLGGDDASDEADADETDDAAESVALPDEDAGETTETADASEAADSTDADGSVSAGEGTSESRPAFAFDETQAKSLYVRPETVALLEDAEFEVESVLRREHGIRDLTGREFHDALVRAVAANPEAVAEFVVDAREE